MKPNLTFIHWGYQCPWCEKSIETLMKLAEDGRVACRFEDVASGNRRTPLASSFLTIADGRPLSASPILEWNWRMLFDEEIRRTAPNDAEKPQAALDRIKALDAVTILDSIAVCNNYAKGMSKKEEWYARNRGTYFGFVGYKDGRPACMLEICASTDCPYGLIEKSPDMAQIICVYSNAGDLDYTLDIVGHAEKSLVGAYERMQIIVGGRTKYPNGTKALFESAGYAVAKELGPQYLLGKGYDDMYAMQKALV